MKILDIPKTITVKSIGSSETRDLPFKEFLTSHIDTYSAIKTPSQVRQASKIIDAIEAGEKAIQLEDADFEVLKAAVTECKFLAGLARQMIPYFDAIDNAQEVKKPTEKKE